MSIRTVVKKSSVLAAVAASGLLATSVGASAEEKYSTLLFTGFDAANDSWAIFKGGLYWLNRDWASDGFVLRGVAVIGGYDYTGGVSGITPIDGDYYVLEGMVGYQFFRGGHRFAVFVGVETQDHDLSPNDLTNSVRGSDTGVKVAGEVTLNLAPLWQANLRGSYSTAFDSYWSKFSLGYKIADHIKIGPEAYLTGNQESDSQRVGGFAEFTSKFLDVPVYLTLSGGYQFGNEGQSSLNSSDGLYATGAIAIAF